MYCDLNIIDPQSTLHSPNDLLELITSAICDGYSILAINHIKTGLVANETIEKQSYTDILNKIADNFKIFN